MDKQNQPLVTVVTAAFNCEKFIGETIQSVQNQTYENWEMILVDDYSTDGTLDVLQRYAAEDDRIKVMVLEENSGAAVARNKALNSAKSKYVAFLDSDDLWLPEKLEKQIAFMQENDYAFTFTAYKTMDEFGNDLGQVVQAPKQMDYKGLLKNTIIGCLTVVIDVEKTGVLQMPLIRTRQDWALWLSVLKRGYIAYGYPEVLARYRKVKGSISSNKFKAAKQNFYVYRHVEKLSLPYALYNFIHYVWTSGKKHFNR
ncbi:glycosyltransferase family 2 protein [Alkalihalobacillus deserti]|uniref:glycosyltransferase family 2 protein n=1 Tax=Alkalihalobacillus deserti TaxID=2879466 RepID=UPI001D149236|nr:glycosyltransferase family 2 protein [Alkalihalobacillus deserti]